METLIITPKETFYAADSPSFDGVFEGRRSAAAGCDLVSMGEVGFDGGEVAMLSRSSRAARALRAGYQYEQE
jgi:hypothetical protein